jgi:hypothetical protein
MNARENYISLSKKKVRIGLFLPKLGSPQLNFWHILREDLNAFGISTDNNKLLLEHSRNRQKELKMR